MTFQTPAALVFDFDDLAHGLPAAERIMATAATETGADRDAVCITWPVHRPAAPLSTVPAQTIVQHRQLFAGAHLPKLHGHLDIGKPEIAMRDLAGPRPGVDPHNRLTFVEGSSLISAQAVDCADAAKSQPHSRRAAVRAEQLSAGLSP